MKLPSRRNHLSAFALFFEEICELPFDQFCKKLGAIKGIPIASLTLRNLYQLNAKLTGHGHGVYLFYRKNTVRYIGKNSSRTYLERIPAHFDVRIKSWFNSYIRAAIRDENLQRPYDSVASEKRRTFARKAEQIFERDIIKFVVFPAKNEKKSDEISISALENLLRRRFQEATNKLSKRKTDADFTPTVKNMVKTEIRRLAKQRRKKGKR